MALTSNIQEQDFILHFCGNVDKALLLHVVEFQFLECCRWFVKFRNHEMTTVQESRVRRVKSVWRRTSDNESEITLEEDIPWLCTCSHNCNGTIWLVHGCSMGLGHLTKSTEALNRRRQWRSVSGQKRRNYGSHSP